MASWAQALAAISKAAPKIAKQLPKLWPLLLESKNRERLGGFFVDLANASPSKRLRARTELTAALADEIAQGAESAEERERAQGWSRRARKLTLRQDLPVSGRTAKTENRRKIRAELDKLQAEMDDHLGSDG